MNRPYATRPDPDEPWRYACPDCSSHRLTRSNTDHFVCEECHAGWDRSALVNRTEVDDE